MDYEPKIFIYRCSGDVVGEIVYSDRQESRLRIWLDSIDAEYQCEILTDVINIQKERE